MTRPSTEVRIDGERGAWELTCGGTTITSQAVLPCQLVKDKLKVTRMEEERIARQAERDRAVVT